MKDEGEQARERKHVCAIGIKVRMKPNLAVFGALINGCRILGQPRRALSLNGGDCERGR